MAEDAARIAALRDRLLATLRAAFPASSSTAAREHRIAGNLNLTFPAAPARGADGAPCPDLCVSTGSACSSAEVEPSYVLRALGLTEAAAARTLRIGIGRFTSAADIDYAAAALAAAHATRRACCEPRPDTGPDAEDDFHRARRHAPRGGCAARPVGAGDRPQARRRYRGRLRGLARLLDLPRDRRPGLVRQAGAADRGRGGHARPRLRAGARPRGSAARS